MVNSKSNFKYRLFNFLIRFGCFCIFVIVGMVVIVAIEKTGKEEKQRKSKLLSDLQINMTLKYNLTRNEFELFADAIYDAKSPAPEQWTYDRGFAFVIQLLTTIGYGNITPVTDGGKVFTIFFALFGIPVTILMLSTVGEEMLNCQKYIIRKIETGWLKKQEVSYLEVKSLITAFVIIFFLILVIAILSFKHHKDWTFLDSFYCWFITFTTVGFGDFIPGDGWNDLPKEIAFTLYVLLCLCAMSNLLNIAGELASPGIFKIQFDSHADATREVGTKENKDIVNTENTWV